MQAISGSRLFMNIEGCSNRQFQGYACVSLSERLISARSRLYEDILTVARQARARTMFRNRVL